MAGGGGKGGQTTTSKVEIPKFLEPFLRQSANVGQGALGQVQNLLQPGTSLVAGFTPEQEQALQQQTAVAGGAGGFIPTAQDALMSTARGDFLFGGPGFDEAVQASLRAAQPGILSAFGAAGRGVSGLGQAATQRAASDAFASLFSQERSRQLNAAQLLPSIGLAGSNILSQVGGQRQVQAQRELEGPVAAQQQLLASALGVTPSQQGLLAGRSVTQPGPSPLASIFGGISTAGGLLGGLPGLGKGGGGFVNSAGVPIPGFNPFFS